MNLKNAQSCRDILASSVLFKMKKYIFTVKNGHKSFEKKDKYYVRCIMGANEKKLSSYGQVFKFIEEELFIDRMDEALR